MNRGRFAFLGGGMSPDASDSLVYGLTASPALEEVSNRATRRYLARHQLQPVPYGILSKRAAPDPEGTKRRALRRALAEQDAVIRSLLGRWVSEFEPTLAFDRAGRLLGLSHGGTIHVGIDFGEER
jgi:hypothetical protein